MLLTLLLSQVAGAAGAEVLRAARFAEPTGRYDHGILGDAVEWGALVLERGDGSEVTLRLPQSRVFEDVAPRLFRDAQGRMRVMVVETDLARGARLAIYASTGRVAETPYIGRSHRWLAPLGAGDLDGDGRIEVAYIDRPHLLRTLRIWRLSDSGLEPVAAQPGLSNHRIGWDFIAGGIADCAGGPVMITANGDWTQIIVSRLQGGHITSTPVGRYTGPESFAAYQESCGEG